MMLITYCNEVILIIKDALYNEDGLEICPKCMERKHLKCIYLDISDDLSKGKLKIIMKCKKCNINVRFYKSNTGSFSSSKIEIKEEPKKKEIKKEVKKRLNVQKQYDEKRKERIKKLAKEAGKNVKRKMAK